MLVSPRPTSDIFLQFSFYCTGFFKIKLQSRTHSMGQTPLVPPFPFPVMLYNDIMVFWYICLFQGQHWKEEGKGRGAQHINVNSI